MKITNLEHGKKLSLIIAMVQVFKDRQIYHLHLEIN
jgi:hypothetical protein